MAKSKLPLVALAVASLAAPALAQPCDLLAETRGADAKNWWVVNDGVMGGLSEGGMTFYDSHMAFSGILNTNGGGFSSIRRSLGDMRLHDEDVIAVSVKGDGRAYELTLGGGTSINYRARLVSEEFDDWEMVQIPVADFRPYFRGRLLRDRKIPADAINTIGIIIADGIDGPFQLEMRSISICRGDTGS